jgi:hypothetical protein
MPIDPKFLRAEELGIRLEVVSGLPIWEAHPVKRHNRSSISCLSVAWSASLAASATSRQPKSSAQ